MADGRTVITLKEDELLTFVRRCFEWRKADVFAFGSQDSISRLGEIAGYISMLHHAKGKVRADAITIFLPPTGDRCSEAMRDDVRAGVHRAYRRIEDDDCIIPFAQKADASLCIVQVDDFTGKALAARLAKAKEREAVIVGEASLYRFQDVTRAGGTPTYAEDVWCAHLHDLMLAAEEAARSTGSYVILDIGKYLPGREVNLELLKSVGDVGLAGGSFETKMTPEEVIEQVGALYDASSQRDIGRALAAIEAEPRMSERQKWMLRLVMLGRAGMRDQVSEVLDTSAETISTLDTDTAVGVAAIAAEADRVDMAQILLERVLPKLMSETDLENALHVAQTTRRLPLVEKVRDKFRLLHPQSDVLRVDNAQTAAREGDYARAAALLTDDSDARRRELGQMYGLLAEAAAGVGSQILSRFRVISANACRGAPPASSTS